LIRGKETFMKHAQKALVITSLVLLTTCQSETENHNKTVEVQTGLNFEQKEIIVSWENCVKPDSSCTYFKVDYLEAMSKDAKTTKKFNNIIQKELITQLKGFGDGNGIESNIQQIGKAFVEDYDAFIKEFPDSKQFWTVEAHMTKTYNSADITTLLIDLEYYTGGAHNNYASKYLNFKTQSGDLIALADVFPDTIQLRQALTDALRKTVNGDLGKAGFSLDGGEVPLTDNFGFTKKGFIFHFDPYMIAPFSMGSIEIEISREVVKNKSGLK